uniref:Uncharacterized protein n=1 Tax=Cacopsylla melanoneura TaxID=428564 RepID=A0A8D8TU18_9HEMI
MRVGQTKPFATTHLLDKEVLLEDLYRMSFNSVTSRIKRLRVVFIVIIQHLSKHLNQTNRAAELIPWIPPIKIFKTHFFFVVKMNLDSDKKNTLQVIVFFIYVYLGCY